MGGRFRELGFEKIVDKRSGSDAGVKAGLMQGVGMVKHDPESRVWGGV